MIYQILANKWRPKDFNQVVSQDSTIAVLKNSLDQNKLHHAYLFTGTRGVGKTTIARIFAKSLVCEQGISSSPCNKCDLCQMVDSGRCLDVIEIDAASKTKVEDTRTLLDNLAYAPNQARFKIYIIDEVHMLSHHSFNALLKSLEEPPLHVKFLLATTDPQKLPITVLSRCLQFKLKSFQINHITAQLEKILVTENKSFDTAGLIQIAKAANGSMRDALSLLEQVLAFSNNQEVSYAMVIQVLHIPQNIQLIQLLTAIINSNLDLSLNIIKELYLADCDPNIILQELQSILKNLIILKLSPDHINTDLSHLNVLLELSSLTSHEELQLYYEIVINSFKNLAFVPDLQVGLEMMVLRMMAFKPLKVVNTQKLEPKDLQLVTCQVQQDPTEIIKENPNELIQIIEQLTLSGLAKELARSSVFKYIDQHKIKMIINQEQKLIANTNNIKMIQHALNHALKRDITITIEIQDFSKDINLQHNTFKYINKMREQNFIAKDNNLKALIKNFDGEIEELTGFSNEN